MFLQHKLRNAEVVESMGMLPGLHASAGCNANDYMARHGAARGCCTASRRSANGLRYCQQSFALGAGALLVIDGQLSPGAMIAANVLMSRALAPIDLMVGTWRAFPGRAQQCLRAAGEAARRPHPGRDPA